MLNYLQQHHGILSAILALGGLALTVLLESVWPRYDWSLRDRALHFLRNLLLWLTLGALASIAVNLVIAPVQNTLLAHPLGVLNFLHAPYWVTWVVGLVLADFSGYIMHRLAHRSRLLWLLHSVHHSDPRVDASTSLRLHPLEPLVPLGFRVMVMVAFGIPLEVLLFRDLLGVALSHLHHAGIGWTPAALARWERWVGWLIVTPGQHLTHHSPDVRYTDSNFGQLFSCWDRWFGTYQPTLVPLPETGLRRLDAVQWQTWWGMLRTPWAVRRFADQL